MSWITQSYCNLAINPIRWPACNRTVLVGESVRQLYMRLLLSRSTVPSFYMHGQLLFVLATHHSHILLSGMVSWSICLVWKSEPIKKSSNHGDQRWTQQVRTLIYLVHWCWKKLWYTIVLLELLFLFSHLILFWKGVVWVGHKLVAPETVLYPPFQYESLFLSGLNVGLNLLSIPTLLNLDVK